MSDQSELGFVEERRDAIRQWLDESAPFTAVDQKHLEAHSPEQAYWHHGYQAACNDIIDLMASAQSTANAEDDCP